MNPCAGRLTRGGSNLEACVSHCVLRIYLLIHTEHIPGIVHGIRPELVLASAARVRREESQQGGIKCEFTIYAVLQHTHNYPNFLTQLPHGERGCVLAAKSQSHMKNERTDDMMTWT